jgi:cell division protein ZapA
MAQVSFLINGRPYEVACGDGEEDHLRDLADYVDQTVQKLVTSVGQAGDARLLVMASLMIADDLSEALQKLDEPEPGATAQDNGAEQDAAGALENYAERLEKIAARLEAT